MPTSEPSLRQLWWTVPAAGFLLLIGLAAILGRAEDPLQAGTSYDAGSTGYRAAYLLLEDLDYPVVRSKRPTGEAVRWALVAEDVKDDPQPLDRWVQEGGRLLLADAKGALARKLGIELQIQSDADAGVEQASGPPDVHRLATGKVRALWPGQTRRVWARVGTEPLVTVHPRGRGEVWLLHRPEVLANRQLRQADNAVFACRLAEAMLEGQDRRDKPAGSAARRDKPAGSLAFDEFVHGLRERPGFVALLLEPPALWITLQSVLLLGVLLWHFMPRFGAVRPLPPTSRRSREEFLDAYASLLERKGDRAEAWRWVRNDLLREIEADLGLPPGTPVEQVAREAARRRPIEEAALRRVLDEQAPEGIGPAGFLLSLDELERIRTEYFHGRDHR